MANVKLPRIRKKSADSKQRGKNLAPDKLTLLITVVNRTKAEYFVDLIQSFGANMQMQTSGFGTARKNFGIMEADSEKQVIFSVLRQDVVPHAIEVLEEKFASIRGGKGIAFIVPLSGTIGVAAYKFLGNIEQ